MLGPNNLVLPHGYSIECAVDTGTYMNAAIAFVHPDDPIIFIVEEFPNYRYVAGEIELLGMSTPEWARSVVRAFHRYRPGITKCKAWADQNNQFKAELAHYNLHLMGNTRKLELRVEITREYQMAKDGDGNKTRLFFAPWLKVIPYEMERAQWPPESTSAGKFERIKQKDHGLDCVEHICSRRPRSARQLEEKRPTFLERHVQKYRKMKRGYSDPHLGSL